MIFSHIVAASENNVIGTHGGLPWHIPKDLKFFKEKTQNKILILGRKTLESFPNKKPLPRRLHLVITRQKDYFVDGALTFNSLDAAISFCKKIENPPHALKEKLNLSFNLDSQEVFIAGGGEIYQQSLMLIDRIYLTRIYKNIDGDTLYPEIPLDRFQLRSQMNHRDNGMNFSFLYYEKLAI